MPTPRRLTDPQDLRALAHPVRMAIIEQLNIHGPLTASQLADRIDESPANCSWHLRKLAEHGFVEEAGGGRGRQRPWQAVGMGMEWQEHPESEAERLAADALGDLVIEREADRWTRARQCLRSDSAEWQEATGLYQAGLWLTAEELAEVNAAVESVLADKLERHWRPELRPSGARLCAFLAWGAPVYTADGRPMDATEAPGPTASPRPDDEHEHAEGER